VADPPLAPGPEIAQIVHDLGLQDQAHAFVGELGPLADERRLVDTARNLDELGADYHRFLEVNRRRSPRTDQDCLRARVAMVQDYHRFPYLDPDLPDAFLPASWPGRAAAASFRERYAVWAPTSERYWDEIGGEE
jgi:phenylacetic acid degradation operon negative regulatory protein